MNNLSRHIRSLALVAILIAAFASCRSQKESSVTAVPGGGTTAVTPYETLISSSSPSWTAVRVPFTLRLTSPKEISLGGIATMSRDRSVLLSFRMLGFEVAALQVTGDSLTVIEKMNKQYLTVPVSKALGGFDACVANVQDLLTGRAFLLGADSLSLAMASDFTLARADGGRSWTLSPKRLPRLAAYSFSLSPSGRLEALNIVPDSYPEATVAYPSHAATPCGEMASSAAISAEVKDSPLRAVIDWDWRKARFDSDVDVRPLTVGRGYRPLDVSSLLKMLPSQNK